MVSAFDAEYSDTWNPETFIKAILYELHLYELSNHYLTITQRSHLPLPLC